ncbi:hypothetical protein GZ998_02070 [Actinomyces sp. 594]|uniref:hypothetical protein n=1 Tax=Actinomyces sp. 594 TaxID=2057793 RepID=UPI001C592AAD|nr:hypothetical protein [Actinomyces sp. 594]MBW3068305.1 hypothetical protein [Actinomyces sp. 594]
MPDLPDGAGTPAADASGNRHAPEHAPERGNSRIPAVSNPQAAAKAARRRKTRTITAVLSIVMLIVVTVAWVYDPARREADSLSGYVSGVAMGIFALWLIGRWVRRRGGSSYSRALDGTQDERDEQIWKSAWAMTGKVAWYVVLGAVIVALLGAEIDLGTAAVGGMWINIVILYGSRFYYERTM